MPRTFGPHFTPHTPEEAAELRTTRARHARASQAALRPTLPDIQCQGCDKIIPGWRRTYNRLFHTDECKRRYDARVASARRKGGSS